MLSKKYTVSDWSRIWLETYKKGCIAEKTFYNYNNILKNHIIPNIGDMKLNKVRQVDIMKIFQRLSNYSLRYIKDVHKVVNQLFSSALNNQLIDINPVIGIRLPKGKVSKPYRILSDIERKEILKLAKTHRFGIWVKLLLLCGLRPSETGRLRKCHIDVENRLIYVDGTKSVYSKREVPITDSEFLNELVEYTKNMKENDLLFTTQNGKEMTDGARRFYWVDFKKYLPDNCGADLSPYCLRHTFCTDMQHAGVPITIAAKLMGHRDSRITAQIYMHYTNESLQMAAEKLKEYREKVI